MFIRFNRSPFTMSYAQCPADLAWLMLSSKLQWLRFGKSVDNGVQVRESLAFSGSTFCVITQFIIWRGRTEIKCLPILFFVFFFLACSRGNVNFGGFVLIM